MGQRRYQIEIQKHFELNKNGDLRVHVPVKLGQLQPISPLLLKKKKKQNPKL
jgi:hypothetical protein